MNESRLADPKDIVARLKADKSYRDGKHGPQGHPCHCWICDSITEIEQLREAVKPFAAIKADDGDAFARYPDSAIIRCEVTAGEIRAAREALES